MFFPITNEGNRLIFQIAPFRAGDELQNRLTRQFPDRTRKKNVGVIYNFISILYIYGKLYQVCYPGPCINEMKL